MLISRTDAGRYRAMRVLAAGLALFALAALISVHNHTAGDPWCAHGLGAVYLIGGLVIALASRSTLEADESDARSQFSGMWSTLPHLPVIVALVSVIVPYARDATLSPVLLGTLLSTSVLAVVRQLLNSLVVRGLVLDLEDQRRRLDHLAHHDMLTGLPNRTAFQVRGEQALTAIRPGTVTGVLLRTAAGRITLALRDGDTAARLGGDEFAVVVPDVKDLSAAVAVGDRILREFAAAAVRGSVGVTVSSAPGRSLDELLHEADTALYAAKAAGKGLVRAYCTPSLAIGSTSSRSS
ncbi:GGDEF domain-containing protein [Actinoplanes missouriensis]|uniref:GGDEF domain-containing protein n=1 Tax=Actinoplanes missouriensis TaxID=1866 RepID=UPI0033D3B38E